MLFRSGLLSNRVSVDRDNPQAAQAAAQAALQQAEETGWGGNRRGAVGSVAPGKDKKSAEEEEQAEEEAEGGELVEGARTTAVATRTSEPADRTDDPVRMYLREMGSVELLSREGEIAIAKRIEAGRDTMIRGLCESALTFEAIMVWREELGSGRILLREVIDLEQTYGGQNASAVFRRYAP